MARGKLRFLSVILALATLAACENEAPKEAGVDPIQLMADLHCEAVSLRKARFELADKMRFMEDTLMQPSTSDSAKALLQSQLNDLEPYKDSVVNRSLDLAKIIKFKLDSLIEQEFTEMEQRKSFDADLAAELEKRGCQ
ncbi:MAG: hypothetical protein KBF73_02765 [Flavobacteriales bacterium]|nr:hypothetical protein [Flavobacteriales bacterium]